MRTVPVVHPSRMVFNPDHRRRTSARRRCSMATLPIRLPRLPRGDQGVPQYRHLSEIVALGLSGAIRPLRPPRTGSKKWTMTMTSAIQAATRCLAHFPRASAASSSWWMITSGVVACVSRSCWTRLTWTRFQTPTGCLMQYTPGHTSLFR